ncbi:MAG TPA: hypothetical protein VGF75_03965 [Candidatus Saccharimonadales bacterium]|jgi:type II secretory pathway pseudopilin PulG
MFKRLKKLEDGDTIIEVLISLAILVLVLSGAYYAASLSYRNDRDSQEHSQALTIAQSELEELRVYGDSFNQIGGCMNPPDSPAAPNSCFVASNNTSDFFSSQRSCIAAGVPYCYDVVIKIQSTSIINQNQPSPTVTVNTYKVQVTWPELGGSNDDSVSLYYRLDS